MQRPATLSIALTAVVLGSFAATSSARQTVGSAPTDPSSTTAVAGTATTPIVMQVREGNEQIEVFGLPANTAVEVRSGPGGVTLNQYTDANGAATFRELRPGDGYAVHAGAAQRDGLHVRSATEHPTAAFYQRQRIAPGFGYVETRDGTTLSVNVVLPGPADQGPYPTVIEYNGYSPSNPADSAFASIYTTLGYAYVGVNMRGTGCSGGSFGLFDLNNALDGYDVIETIAAQPWVLHGSPGMVGISYGGISQLFVAATQPPHLAAITPLSVLDDSFRSNGFPGGMLNTGFAEGWLRDRYETSKPFGLAWTKQIADGGDTVCAANQMLRLQHPDLVTVNRSEPFFPGFRGAGAKLVTADLAGKITVPVFLAGAWQDEQTGGRFATMLDRFTAAADLFVDLTNGGHTDALNPTTMQRYAEFLSFYVAKRIPDVGGLKVIAPALGNVIFGAADHPAELGTNRFAGQGFDQARAAFEDEPAVRVLLESGGAAKATAGAPVPNEVFTTAAWPVPTATATRWYLGPKGTLTDQPTPEPDASKAVDHYRADPAALPATFYHGNSTDIWKAKVDFDWQPLPEGTGVGYVTPRFRTDTLVAGSGSADLWIDAGQADTDLEVTISEVRRDGTEIYVQSGWLRASQRALDAKASSDLRPVQTHTKEDAAPLPVGTFTLARVEIYPFAHPFRAGSRLRVTVDAPGNSRAVWVFATESKGERVRIARDPDHPSSIVLAIVADPPQLGKAPKACGSLRGQPCRKYRAAANGG